MVYVDNMRIQYGNMVMCHMVADTEEELHTLAARLGLKREWFQPGNNSLPHYDISMSRRRMAVQLGAREITAMEIGKMNLTHAQRQV